MELRELDEGNVQTLVELLLEGKEGKSTVFAKCGRMRGVRLPQGLWTPYGSALGPTNLGQPFLNQGRNKKRVLHSPHNKNFCPRKFTDGIERKPHFPHALRQPPPKHDRFDDSNTYSHHKLYLCVMRYVSNNVTWVSHYSRTNFQLATLTLGLLPHTCLTNLYLIY